MVLHVACLLKQFKTILLLSTLLFTILLILKEDENQLLPP